MRASLHDRSGCICLRVWPAGVRRTGACATVVFMFKRVGVLIVVLLGSLACAQGAEATIRAKCAAEWPGDPQMRAYCEGMQREGLLEVQQLNARNGGVPVDAYRVASGRCVTDWPDDYSMQAYCLRQQLEGYAAVSRGPSSPLVTVTSQEAAVITRGCSLDWPTDYSMQAYCQRQQVEGLAFIRNRPPTVPTSTWGRLVNACELEWRNDYSMQAYCVRRALG